MDEKHLKNFKDVCDSPKKQEGHVMSLEVQVDTTPQALRKIKPYFSSSKSIPTSLPAESQIVLHALFSCFEKQQRVEEGVIKDLVWGFEQGGIPPECSMLGLTQLQGKGYIKFQAPDNTFVTILSDQLGECWIRYQPKLLEMIYESSSSE